MSLLTLSDTECPLCVCFFLYQLGYSHFFFCFLSPPARIFQGGKKKKVGKKKSVQGFHQGGPGWDHAHPIIFSRKIRIFTGFGGYMVTPEKNGVWRL